MSKVVLTVLLFGIVTLGQAQKKVSISQAENDLEKHKEELIQLLAVKYGIDTGLKGIQITYQEGPYVRYSMNAESYGWKYVSKPDLLIHKFKATTPTYDNGNKFLFEIEVVYNAHEYGFFGARKYLGEYVYNGISLNMTEFQGKEISQGLLQDRLNLILLAKPSLLQADDFQFVQIDSIGFEKQEETKILGWPGFYYQIDVYGLGVDIKDGYYEKEYEVERTAKLHATFTAAYYLYEGSWKMNQQYFYFKDVQTYEESTSGFVPAYKKLDETSLVEMIGGAQIVESIPSTSLRKVNDLKRLIVYRYSTCSKETFIEGELLTKMFSSTAGKEALDELYSFKDQMKAYALDSVSLRFSNMAEKFEEDNSTLDLVLNFTVKRDLESAQVKSYKGKVSKEAYKLIKYRAKGYMQWVITARLLDGSVKIEALTVNNFVTYNNGGSTKHPLD